VYEASKHSPSSEFIDLSTKALSEQIRQRARELGFQLVGIVPAQALTAERERLDEWLARGYHGNMSWMARDPEQ